jgi:hypothetical protein
LPEKRTKPSWSNQNNQVKFAIDPKQNETGQNSFDLIKEINSSKLGLSVCWFAYVLV